MKKMFVMILVIALALGLLLLPGCSKEDQGTGESLDIVVGEPGANDKSEASVTETAMLYADFAAFSEPPVIDTHPYEYEGELTVDVLCAGLSEWTGYDFVVDAYTPGEANIWVDWSEDSSLFSGKSEDYDEFFFFAADVKDWFMLDSLWRTIMENIDTEGVFYTMKGGEELSLESISYPAKFLTDTPYMGSRFYVSHDNTMGDEIVAIWTELEGYWVDNDDFFIGFSKAGSTLYFEYGMLNSGFWETVELIDYYLWDVGMTLTLYSSAREASEGVDARDESEWSLVIGLGYLESHGIIKTEVEGDVTEYTYYGKSF